MDEWVVEGKTRKGLLHRIINCVSGRIDPTDLTLVRDGWKIERIDGLPKRNRLLRGIEYHLMGKTYPVNVIMELSREINKQSQYLTIRAFDNNSSDTNISQPGRIPEETLTVTSTVSNGAQINNKQIIEILRRYDVDGYHSVHTINGVSYNKI